MYWEDYPLEVFMVATVAPGPSDLSRPVRRAQPRVRTVRSVRLRHGVFLISLDGTIAFCRLCVGHH